MAKTLKKYIFEMLTETTITNLLKGDEEDLLTLDEKISADNANDPQQIQEVEVLVLTKEGDNSKTCLGDYKSLSHAIEDLVNQEVLGFLQKQHDNHELDDVAEKSEEL